MFGGYFDPQTSENEQKQLQIFLTLKPQIYCIKVTGDDQFQQTFILVIQLSRFKRENWFPVFFCKAASNFSTSILSLRFEPHRLFEGQNSRQTSANAQGSHQEQFLRNFRAGQKLCLRPGSNPRPSDRRLWKVQSPISLSAEK